MQKFSFRFLAKRVTIVFIWEEFLSAEEAQWDIKGSFPERSGKYSSFRVREEYVGKRSVTLFPFENSCFRS